MSSKAFALLFGVFALLVVVQSRGQTKGDRGKEFRGYVEVNGTSYFIETSTPLYRDEAQVECNALNMSLISFPSEQKFDDTVQWLSDNGFASNWVWTGALKVANSIYWLWEPSGLEFTYFRWAPNQPSEIGNQDRLCINFRGLSQGWDDDYCDGFIMGYICE
ncbi:perlucin-like protein [Neocloeon triangulifer]|uniref:perlucin-like protein n=1 Tax=Neocloeon triangulifer TaxID=2078957 RepID=UPI00286F648B|nr:perlucin-like protein [Neocloeon triangulifer]